MLPEYFVIIGVIIGSIGTLTYLIDTIRGKVQPNKVTWFLWALAPLIAFAAQLGQDVGIQSLMTFSVGFTPLLVFFASFINKKSQWRMSRFDIVCGALSLVGLGLWFITQNGNVAILFSILADALAALPTVLKSYRDPSSENYVAFLLGGINSIFTMLTIKLWNFETVGFPLYIFMICAVLFVLIYFKIGDRVRVKQNEQ